MWLFCLADMLSLNCHLAPTSSLREHRIFESLLLCSCWHAGKPNSPFSAKIRPFSAKTPVLGKISPFAVQSSRYPHAIFSIEINVVKEKWIVIEISERFVKKSLFYRDPCICFNILVTDLPASFLYFVQKVVPTSGVVAVWRNLGLWSSAFISIKSSQTHYLCTCRCHHS